MDQELPTTHKYRGILCRASNRANPLEFILKTENDEVSICPGDRLLIEGEEPFEFQYSDLTNTHTKNRQAIAKAVLARKKVEMIYEEP